MRGQDKMYWIAQRTFTVTRFTWLCRMSVTSLMYSDMITFLFLFCLKFWINCCLFSFKALTVSLSLSLCVSARVLAGVSASVCVFVWVDGFVCTCLYVFVLFLFCYYKISFSGKWDRMLYDLPLYMENFKWVVQTDIIRGCTNLIFYMCNDHKSKIPFIVFFKNHMKTLKHTHFYSVLFP